MQIKTTVNSDGCAKQEVIHPKTGEVVSCQTIEPGQETTLTAITAHEASDIEVGEVTACTGDSEGGDSQPDGSGGETPQ